MFTRIIILLLVIFSITNCNNESTGNNLLNEPCPTCFTEYPSNPILERTDTQWDGIFDIDEDSFFDNWTPCWNDPHVIKIGNKHVMFVSASDDFPNTADPPVPDIRIYRLESDDGYTWTPNPITPVFKKSSTLTNWDSSGTETPAVVEFQGKHHLFYTGYDGTFSDSSRYRIGHAVSTDGGKTWTRNVNNPILIPTGVPTDFNGSVVAEPAPVVYNNQIYLYFTAIGYNSTVADTLQVIGLTKTVLDSNGNWDEQSFTTPVSVLIPDQTIYPRTSDWYGYTTPSAFVLNGKVHLYFSVVNDNPSWAMIHIHHASSSDGINNWSHDSTYTYTKGDFSWANNSIHSPSPYLNGSVLMLYYAGHDIGGATNKFGIGVSIYDLVK